MNKTPEIIYLIPGEDLDGAPAMVWCDDPAPSYADDPDEAVKYVRADHISDSGEVVTDNSRVTAELTEEIGHLEDSLIKLGQMLREIVNITKGPPEENSWHSTHDAVESVERLQSRVAELYDLIKYAQVESGVCMCGDNMQDHNQASGHSPVDVWDHAVEQVDKEGSSEAFILRKQAEAIDYVLSDIEIMLWHGVEFVAVSNIEYYANTLRAEADAEGDTNED